MFESQYDADGTAGELIDLFGFGRVKEEEPIGLFADVPSGVEESMPLGEFAYESN